MPIDRLNLAPHTLTLTLTLTSQGWDAEGGADHPSGTVMSLSGAPEFLVAWVTAPNITEAKALSEGLVMEELAACVNIVPGVESVYKWEGKVREVIRLVRVESV